MVSRIDYSQKKQILAISLGNGFEAYDFVLYGMLAQTFSVVFFPDNMDADIRVILSFILFLSAYIARPFGALLWGVIGDKFGRKVVLTYTISLMSVSAIGMILIPGYAVIGAAAPVIVIILRIIQGIAFSGEFPTVMVSLYESAPDNRKGFFCSFTEITGTFGHFIGIILCVFLIFYMDKNVFMTYGWKIPFGFSLIFIFVVYYIRTHFIETLNISSENKVRIPIISNFRDNIWSSLKITLFVSTNSFLLFSFLFYTNRLISNYHAQPVDDYIFSWIVQLCCVGLLVTFLVIIGSIVDRIGIMKVSFIGHILILIFYYPIFYYLILSGSLVMNIIGIFILSIFLAMLAVSYIPIIVKMSNPACRISVVSIGWACSVILFGASSPLVSEIMIKMTGMISMPALYLVFLSFISLLIMYNIYKEENHA